MADSILVVNAGSSSLKFSVFLAGERLTPFLRQLEELMSQPRFVVRDANGIVIRKRDWPERTSLGHQGTIEFLLSRGLDGALGEYRIVAAGHRVVHGGVEFALPVRIDADVLAALDALVPLAPLHQPHNLAGIRAVAQQAPHLPQVACFDTAFHRSQPAVAQAFALPRRYAEEGIRRYGFHGLSYEYIASVLPGLDARAATGRTVVAHLGNGASMCAMQGCRSVATTMSFTPLDGLVMGTRCGALDPAVILFLMDQHRLDCRALEKLLYHESGLLGVSGISSDMRTLPSSPEVHAREAVELFIYRCGRELGSLAAALGGLDALVFTGGIGENAASIRASICQTAAWLGLELDEAVNQAGGPRLSRPSSRVTAWVIPTNEELMIVQHTRRLLFAFTVG